MEPLASFSVDTSALACYVSNMGQNVKFSRYVHPRFHKEDRLKRTPLLSGVSR